MSDGGFRHQAAVAGAVPSERPAPSDLSSQSIGTTALVSLATSPLRKPAKLFDLKKRTSGSVGLPGRSGWPRPGIFFDPPGVLDGAASRARYRARIPSVG